MSRRIALLGVAAAALAPASVALASPGAQPPAPQGERTVQLVSHQHRARIIDNAPRRRVGSGDQAVVGTTLFDEHAVRVGSAHSLCTLFSGGRNPGVVCTGMWVLRDGTLAVSGAFHLQTERHVAAVTGGTGAYAGARGWIESRTAPGGDPNINRDVIHLILP